MIKRFSEFSNNMRCSERKKRKNIKTLKLDIVGISLPI